DAEIQHADALVEVLHNFGEALAVTNAISTGKAVAQHGDAELPRVLRPDVGVPQPVRIDPHRIAKLRASEPSLGTFQVIPTEHRIEAVKRGHGAHMDDLGAPETERNFNAA